MSVFAIHLTAEIIGEAATDERQDTISPGGIRHIKFRPLQLRGTKMVYL